MGADRKTKGKKMIQIKNLKKDYINSKENIVTALRDVDLELDKKGFVFITGDSGSGKTTLLNILGGLDSYTSGSVRVADAEISKFSQKELDEWRGRGMAFIFQDLNLISNYTVAQNIRIGKEFEGHECTDEEISKLLAKVQLKGFEDRYPESLSGGQKQRVAIARAIARNPKILLVDEPTGQLDAKNSIKIMRLLKAISNQILVICVCHQRAWINSYADRILVLEDGKVVDDYANSPEESEESKRLLLEQPEDDNVKKQSTKVKSKKGKYLFTMGLHNLWSAKARSTILACLVSFAILFFSVFYMLSGYDRHLSLANSVKQEDISYAVFNSEYINRQEWLGINEDAKEFLFRFCETDLITGIGSGVKIAGLVEMASPIDSEKNDLGQAILYGEYPDYSDEDTRNTIVISDYLANQIVRSKVIIKEGDAEKTIFPDNIEAVVGKHILIDTEKRTFLEVGGIYNTDYEEFSEISMDDATLARFNYNLANVYSVIHVRVGFVEDYTEISGINSISDVTARLQYINSDTNVVNNIGVYTNVTVANADAYSGRTVYARTGNTAITGSLGDDCVFLSQALYEDFVGVNTQDARIHIKLENGDTHWFSVAGRLQKENPTDKDEYVIIFSDNDFASNSPVNDSIIIDGAMREAMFPTTKLLINTQIPADQLGKIIATITERFDVTYQSSASNDIDAFSDKIETFVSSYFVFGIFSIVLAAALLYSFITYLITKNKRDIGIIRSLGATTKNVFGIYMIAMLSFSLICFVISSAFTVIAGAVVNAVVKQNMGIPFKLMNLSWELFGLILLICLVVSVCATFIPISKYAKQRPIKQLK